MDAVLDIVDLHSRTGPLTRAVDRLNRRRTEGAAMTLRTTVRQPTRVAAQVQGAELAIGLRSLRIVVLIFIALDGLSGLIGDAAGYPDGPSGLVANAQELLGVAACAAIMWRRTVLIVVLLIAMAGLALGIGSSGDELTVLLVGTVVAAVVLTGWRLTAAVTAIGVWALVFALHQESRHRGWGWSAALVVLGFAAVGLAVGLVARRLLAAEARRRERLHRLEIENADIQARERSRLADELQSVVTGGLERIEAELGVLSTSPSPSDQESRPTEQQGERLRAGLDRIDAESRGSLTQLRSLLDVLRRDPEHPTGAPGSVDSSAPRTGWSRWVTVRNVRIAASVVFAARIGQVLLETGTEAGWAEMCVQLLGLLACGLALWRPVGTRIALGLSLTALVLATAAQTTSGWGALSAGLLCVVLTAQLGVRRIWIPLTVVLAYALTRWWLSPLVPATYALLAYAAAMGTLVGLATRQFLHARADSEAQLDAVLDRRDRLAADERNALARELHDVVAHQLSVTAMTVMATSGSSEVEVLRGSVERIRRSTETARGELDVLLHTMRGAAADQVRLTPLLAPVATAQALKRQLDEAGRPTELDLDPGADDLDPTSQRTLTRIMQESTTNILRYAPVGARCLFRLQTTAERVELRITSPTAHRERRSQLSLGWGLRGIRERVELTHGTFAAGPERGQWVVRVQLPASGTPAAHQPD